MLPEYAANFVPVHVYFNRALDAMYAHLTTVRVPLPSSQVGQDDAARKRCEPTDRSERAADLGCARRERDPFDGTTLTIPELIGLVVVQSARRARAFF